MKLNITICTYFSTLFFIISSTPVQAQEDNYHQWLRNMLANDYDINGGAWLIANNEEAKLTQNQPTNGVTVSIETATGQSFSRYLHFSVTEATPETPWQRTVRWPTNSTISNGDALLMILWLRGLSEHQKRGQVQTVVEQSASPFTGMIHETHAADSQWQFVLIPFEANGDYAAGEARFQLNLGLVAQEIDFGGLAILNFGTQYRVSQLPSKPPRNQGASSHTLISDAMHRTFLLHQPPDFSDASRLPVVIHLHGNGATGETDKYYTRLNETADSLNFMVVFPNALGSWNAGFPSGINPTHIDDVGFISNLIDTLISDWNVDPKRVYVSGNSRGAFMAERIACELSDKVAAIAGVSGTLAKDIFNSCNPERPVPVLHIHGTADTVVLYDGAQFYVSVDELLDLWIEHNNVPETPEITQLPDINPQDGSTVTREIYGPGDNGSEVVLFKVNNGDHSWPGATTRSGINQDIDASFEIWNFFRRHTLESAVTNINDSDAITPDVFQLRQNYPNPFNPTTTIQYTLEIDSHVRLIVFNQLGQKIKTLVDGKQTAGEYRIEWDGHNNFGEEVASGVYILNLATENSLSQTRKMILLR